MSCKLWSYLIKKGPVASPDSVIHPVLAAHETSWIGAVA